MNRLHVFILLISLTLGSMLLAQDKHKHKGHDATASAFPKIKYEKPKKGEKFDHVIKMSVKPGLKFSITSFAVKPGSRVKIIFKNNDHEMFHNIVICKPGKDSGKQVGEAALKLGEKSTAMHYVPKHKNVLYSWAVVEGDKTLEFSFTAPKTKGDYPYICTIPGHYQLMKGVMKVGGKAIVKKDNKPKKDPYKLLPKDKSIVYRTALNRYKVASSVTVGSSSGLHYAFDTKACNLALAWRGDYLSTKGDWGGRGGGGSQILGSVFLDTRSSHFLVGNSKVAAKTQHKAYRVNKKNEPTFYYTVDGLSVEHKITTDKDKNCVTQLITVTTAGKKIKLVLKASSATVKTLSSDKNKTVFEVVAK